MLSLRFAFPPDLFFWLVVGSLATLRLTSLLWRESIFEWLRRLLGVKHSTDLYAPAYWEYPDNLIGELIGCFWCLSVWAGIGVAVVWFVWPYALLPLAMSQIAISMHLRDR